MGDVRFGYGGNGDSDTAAGCEADEGWILVKREGVCCCEERRRERAGTGREEEWSEVWGLARQVRQLHDA